MQDEYSRFAQGSLVNSNAVMDKPINRKRQQQQQKMRKEWKKID